ncbi:MAG: DUF58 domain-containing protein [Planctomycetota bacterium]
MASSPSRPRYRFRLTRLGFHFLFVAVFAIVGGSLRGFNLLLVLAGLLVSVVIVQWRQGRSMIRRTRLIRNEVRGVHAGEPFAIRYEVRNVARLLPLWMIRIEDQVRRIASGSSSEVAAMEPGDQADLDTSVGSVLPQRSVAGTLRCRIQQRGKYVLGPAVASTTFPFSLMKCDRMSAGSVEPFYVYPRLIELRRDWQDLLPARRGGDGRRAAGRTDAEGEFFGLRGWQSGDQLKNIHWRTTAKLGYPAVRQFEYRARHQFHLIVDATDESLWDTSDMELLLSFAATLIGEVATSTRSIRLAVVDGREDEAVWRTSSNGDPQPMLKRLAESFPGNGLNLGSATDVLALPGTGELRMTDLVVLSAQPFDANCTEQPTEAARILRDLVYTKRLAWLDIRSRAVRRHLLGFRPMQPLHENQVSMSRND